MKGKKGQVVLYVFGLITMLIIVAIAAFFAPMGVRFNAAMYAAGQDILAESQPDIDSISDASIQAAVNASVAAAKDAAATNITVNANIFQYSWIVALFVTGLVFFLAARRLIEVGAGGFI